MIRVLLLEDSLAMQSAVQAMLKALGGFNVVHTSRRESTTALWMAEHPYQWDLAIVDLLLEDGSGFSAIRRCKTEHPQGRIIVFSEHVTQVLADECKCMGADAAFSKLQLEAFVRHLERLLAS